RSLSAFYAIMGALCLVLATDLERYRPLVRFLGAAFALMSVVLLGVDVAAGMPWGWAASEGPGGGVFGARLFVLARPGDAEGGTAWAFGWARRAAGCGRSSRRRGHASGFVSCRKPTRLTRSTLRSPWSGVTATGRRYRPRESRSDEAARQGQMSVGQD